MISFHSGPPRVALPLSPRLSWPQWTPSSLPRPPPAASKATRTLARPKASSSTSRRSTHTSRGLPARRRRTALSSTSPDVWGIDIFQNGQLLCDYFASNGFLVLAMDYFRGDPVTLHRKERGDTTMEPSFDFEAWKAKHQAFAQVAVPKWIAEVKAKYGSADTKYACVGYCFGAPYVMDALSEDTDWVSVGAFGHPAFLHESHFTKCSRPLLLSCAETDHTFPAESRHRAEALLTERSHQEQGKSLRFQIQFFSGVSHGFCLRGNMEDAWERYTKEESANAIVRWFKLFMD
ncbi:Dienelactone hydrolase [Mycena indigotica]|uniref:Dienelactone hydrolase n=1 Tax=Mycena indigotica TaxID=2126181 RepID=A0A8H6WGU5_9AGAR|nr:Dienelactone hydrolase [Mycena indigotica]KAF7311829.1 Dienelactone hydrolase [Mycena indigotica]